MMINQGMWNDNPFDSWTEEEEHLSNMGVVSFGKGGGPPPTPAHTTTQTTSQYPDELKPFIQDIFGKAKGIEDQRSTDGYQAYDAPRIAGFNQDQQDAFTGIRSAQGASTPYFEAQETLIDRSTAGPSAQRTAQYMNPYTQNVIDIQQRELGRQGAQERQRIGAGAVGAGGFGGSRQAILEAEQMRNQGMRSDDIQAKGMNQAYAQAQQAMSQADARGLQGAGMYGQMATQVPGQAFKELGALAGVGAADQTQQQRALDLGYRQFQDEYNYPMKTLNDYSAILRGFPLPANTSSNQTSYSAVAPLSSQLLGAGAGLTGMAGMAGLFGASGGQVKKLQQGGLASMYAPSNRVEFGKTNYNGMLDYVKGLFIDDGSTGPKDFKAESLENKARQDERDAERVLERIGSPDQNEIDNAMEYLLENNSNLNKEELELGYFDRIQEEERLRRKDAIANREENKRLNLPVDWDGLKATGMMDFGLEGSGTSDEERANFEMQDERYKEAETKYNEYKEQEKERAEGKDEEALARARRIRMAKWAPLMQKARSIAESETLGGAILGGIEGAGDVMMGEAAGEAAEVSRAAGLRSAAIDEAVQLAGINKDLSRDQIRIALMEAANKFNISPEQAKIYRDAAIALGESTLDLTGNIQSLIVNKNLQNQLAGTGPDGEEISFSDALTLGGDNSRIMAQKKGGAVKLAKGGTPERSFDFVPKDGKLIAVPK